MNEYASFTECYLDLARQIYKEPEFICAPRGMKVKEKLGVRFKIKDPLDRLPYVPARNFSVTYVIGELLWYLSGDNKTEWISNYSSFWSKISDDGETANSAYGARIFKSHDRIAGSQLVQWNYVKEELRRDPDSRRAVIHIRSPWDSTHAKLDVPCTLTLQFFIRENKLHMVVNMRSSDLILGIAYDIPAFTIFQELLARELGVGIGEYTHMSNSLHIYERHFEMVEEMLHPENIRVAQQLHNVGGPMLPMPTDPPTSRLYAIEDHIRSAISVDTVNYLIEATADLEDYWHDWVKILAAHRCKKLGDVAGYNSMLNSTSFRGYSIFYKSSRSHKEHA